MYNNGGFLGAAVTGPSILGATLAHTGASTSMIWLVTVGLLLVLVGPFTVRHARVVPTPQRGQLTQPGSRHHIR